MTVARVLALLVASLGLALGPARATFAVPPAGDGAADFVAVHPSGTGENESTDPATTVFTAELVSMTTGELIGTFTDVITCSAATPPPCLVFDVVTTYRLPGGDVVNQGQWTGVPDPQRPGFLLIGTRPDSDTIADATGRFAGRSGRVTGWGTIDAREFPDRLGYSVFTVINFAAGDGVVGSAELLADPSDGLVVADRITQHFRSAGVNRSPDPAAFEATADLVSLATGERHGTARDQASCSTGGGVPCVVFDLRTELDYPQGSVVFETTLSVVPDPQRPGFALVGARPQSDTIVAGTGAFEGRSGRVLISGSIDLRRFPAVAPYEGVSMVVFR